MVTLTLKQLAAFNNSVAEKYQQAIDRREQEGISGTITMSEHLEYFNARMFSLMTIGGFNKDSVQLILDDEEEEDE